MGCDIHCFIEWKQEGGRSWSSFGGRINPGRYYVAFAALAGVRNYFDDVEGKKLVPFSEPRGFPADAGWKATNGNYLYISDEFPDEEGYTDSKSAAGWVERGISVYMDDTKKRVSHPDWHSHSWMRPSEMREALDSLTGILGYELLTNVSGAEWGAMIAAADYLSKFGEARIVFWFDN